MKHYGKNVFETMKFKYDSMAGGYMFGERCNILDFKYFKSIN